MCVRSLHLDPPFLLLAVPSVPFPNNMKSVVNLHNSCNESVDASDELLLSTDPAQSISAVESVAKSMASPFSVRTRTIRK